MKYIHNIRYQMDLGCNLDIWRIFGIDEQGESICPSVPVSCNQSEESFTTASGSVYKICSYEQNKDVFFEHLKNSIEHNGFERH
jgi:hypothetical protein